VLLERSLEAGPRTSGNCSLRCAVFVQGHTADCEINACLGECCKHTFFPCERQNQTEDSWANSPATARWSSAFSRRS